jgi:hypothetical protein
MNIAARIIPNTELVKTPAIVAARYVENRRKLRLATSPYNRIGVGTVATMRRLTAALLCVLALGACSNDKDDPDASDTTTTTAPAAVTTAAPTTTPSGPAATPAAAAKGLLNAWKKGDKDDASRYAKPAPINELFSHPNTGDVDYADQGCTPQGGQFVCSWTYPGGALQMTVENWPGGGYVVDDITYLVD